MQQMSSSLGIGKNGVLLIFIQIGYKISRKESRNQDDLVFFSAYGFLLPSKHYSTWIFWSHLVFLKKDEPVSVAMAT